MYHLSVLFLLEQNDLIEALNGDTISTKTLYMKCVLIILMLISSPLLSCALLRNRLLYKGVSTNSIHINIIL